jgi:selenocysteine lyase/cysteine desulfurase
VTALDLDFARRNFPAFMNPDLDGWVHAENAGGSYPCRQVIDRLTDYYTRLRIQPHHPHPLGQRAGAAMDAGPIALAGLLGVEPGAIVVGPSTTQNTYVLSRALAETLSPGDAIVVTEQDHEANSGCWRRLAKDGIEIREWRVDPVTGCLDLSDLDDLLDERVQIVAVPHASNVIGETNDVAAITDRAHAVGAITVVDGVAHAPHELPDVAALGSDVHLFSSYKTFGPHQGVMVIREDLLARLPNQGHFFNAGIATKRLVPAGPDHAQVASLAGIAAYVDDLDVHHFPDDPAASPGEAARRVSRLWRDHETALLVPLVTYLQGRNDIRVLGPVGSEQRVPTVSIVADRPGAELAGELADHEIMCAGGHFYAHRLMTACGIDPAHGVLRFSLVHTNAPQDITQIIDALHAVL